MNFSGTRVTVAPARGRRSRVTSTLMPHSIPPCPRKKVSRSSISSALRRPSLFLSIRFRAAWRAGHRCSSVASRAPSLLVSYSARAAWAASRGETWGPPPERLPEQPTARSTTPPRKREERLMGTVSGLDCADDRTRESDEAERSRVLCPTAQSVTSRNRGGQQILTFCSSSRGAGRRPPGEGVEQLLGPGVPGLELERLPQLGRRLGHLAFLGQRLAEVPVRLGVLRHGPHRRLERAQGPRPVPLTQPAAAEAQVGRPVIRFQLCHLLKAVRRGGVVPLLEEDGAQVEVGIDRVGGQLGGLAQGPLG